MWIGIIEQRLDGGTTGNDQFDFIISELPTFYKAGSVIIITGRIENNTTGIPTQDLVFQIDFDFGLPAIDPVTGQFMYDNEGNLITEPIIFSPDANGNFTVELNVRIQLEHPDQGQLVITNNNFDKVQRVFDVFTLAGQEDLYTLSINTLNLYRYGTYIISGKAPAGTELLLTSSQSTANNTILFEEQFLIALGDNTYSFEFTVDPSVDIGLYTIYLDSIYGQLSLADITVTIVGFNPYFTRFIPDSVGIPTTIDASTIGTAVDPFTEFTFEIYVNGQLIITQNIIANVNGSFAYDQMFFDVSLSGQLAELRWQRTFPLPDETVVEQVFLPVFTPNITRNFPENPIYSGDEYTFEYFLSTGYEVFHDVFDSNNNLLFTRSATQQTSNDPWNMPLEIPITSVEGTYTFNAYAINHNSLTFNKNVIKGLVVIQPDVNILRLPGDNINISVTSKPNVVITFIVFGNTYTGTTDANGNLTQSIPVSGTYTFDSNNSCVITTPHYPGQKEILLRVDDPALYALTASSPGVIFTNPKQNSFSVSGIALPNKLITVSIPQLGINDTVIGNPNGSWSYSSGVIPWQQGGNYTLTISAPGETTIVYTGIHRPTIRFTPEALELAQGDPTTTYLIRADANETLLVNIEQLQGDLTVSTDASGYYTFNTPAIPLTFFASAILEVKARTIDELYEGTASLAIVPKYPLTINVNTEAGCFNDSGGELNNILFVSTPYQVTGNKPDYENFALSFIGQVGSLNITNKSGFTYSANLVTSALQEVISLIASTIYQEFFKQDYIVDYPLNLLVPSGDLTYDQELVILGYTLPNLIVTLKVQYRSGVNVINETTYNSPSGSSGTAQFVITTLDIVEADTILFIGFVSEFYEKRETRNYSNSLSEIIAPFNSNLIAQFSGSTGISNRIRNLADDGVEIDLEITSGAEFEFNYANINLYNGYLVQKDSSNLGRIQGIELDSPILNVDGFTSFETINVNDVPTFSLFSGFSNVYSLTFVRYQPGNPEYEIRFVVNSVQLNYYYTFSNDFDFYDFCFVFNKSDPINNGNSTFWLYINGELIISRYESSVITFSSSVNNDTLRRPTGTLLYGYNNYLLFDKPLFIDDVEAFYTASGIRKKIRKCTIEDVLINHRNSCYPNNGYGLRYAANGRNYYNGVLANGTEIVTDTVSTYYVIDNNVTTTLDGELRRYFSFNGINRNLIYVVNTFFVHNDHFIVLRRNSLNNQKQVFLDIRLNNLRFEFSFTSNNRLQIDYYSLSTTGSYRTNIYQSNLFSTTNDILCIFFKLNKTSQSSSNPLLLTELRVNGELINPLSSTIVANLPNMTGINRIGIGSKVENINYANVNFYLYFPWYSIYLITTVANDSLIPLVNNNDYPLLSAYIFWILGFKEALEHSFPSFPGLNKGDGFYYI